MRKLDALKKLAVALGVDIKESNDLGDVIDMIADKLAETPKEMILKSSTADSVKEFKITVVDDGTISAIEIVES